MSMGTGVYMIVLGEQHTARSMCVWVDLHDFIMQLSMKKPNLLCLGRQGISFSPKQSPHLLVREPSPLQTISTQSVTSICLSFFPDSKLIFPQRFVSLDWISSQLIAQFTFHSVVIVFWIVLNSQMDYDNLEINNGALIAWGCVIHKTLLADVFSPHL